MNSAWREYWEKRPQECCEYGWLGHGKVVGLSRKADDWHSKRFVDYLGPDVGWTLLDVGCGAGDEIIRYRSKVAQIVGMDFSLGMLKVCRKRLESHRIDNVNLVVGDARSLPFKPGSFDGSICLGVLLFLSAEDVEHALCELSRVTSRKILLHGKNSFSPFGLELRLAEALISRVRNRIPYDHHRPFWWYMRKSRKLGRVDRYFTIGLWIPQMPSRLKSLVGSLEVLAASVGLNHPFGKEYYLVITKMNPGWSEDCS